MNPADRAPSWGSWWVGLEDRDTFRARLEERAVLLKCQKPTRDDYMAWDLRDDWEPRRTPRIDPRGPIV